MNVTDIYYYNFNFYKLLLSISKNSFKFEFKVNIQSLTTLNMYIVVSNIPNIGMDIIRMPSFENSKYL